MEEWIEYLKKWVKPVLPVIVFFWIWIITFIFLFHGIWVNAEDVTLFKVGYTSFALICIILFQFSRDFWQKIIIRFWTFVLIYELFVFVVILLYKIKAIKEFCHNIGLSVEWERNIGFDLDEGWGFKFFVFIVREIFSIGSIIILQVLMVNTPPIARINFEVINNMVEFLDTFFDITKLTIFGIIMTCISKVNAIHCFFLIAAVLSMVFTRNVRYVTIQFISVLAATFLVAEMIMQMHFVPGPKAVSCEVPKEIGSSISLNYGKWVGFGKTGPLEFFPVNVMGYLCIITLVTLHSIVVKERSIIQGFCQGSSWDPRKMFQDSTYLKADVDFKSFVKYVLKYGFYRYGIELTLASIALLIQARLDVWACLHGIWLVIFITIPVRFLPRLWTIFKYFLLVSIPLQYIISLGFWPEKCFGYIEEITHPKLLNVAGMLQIPLGTIKPNAAKMFWDSLVFLFMLCQAQVFEFEKFHAIELATKMTPTKQTRRRLKPQPPVTTFGLARYALFYSLPIICSVMFYIAATSQISIFSFAYAYGFFMILWLADFYFLQPIDETQKFWSSLLRLNVYIILFKLSMQWIGCVFLGSLELNWCWLVQILGIACFKEINAAISFFNVPLIYIPYPDNKLRASCFYVGTTAGIHFDVLCFIFLMFHKRFLLTKYFLAMSREAALDLKFSFRAAKILEELNIQEMEEMKEKHTKNLAKIHKKMAYLKETQKKIRGLKLTDPLTHQEVVTSGDYYMFNDTNKDLLDSAEEETEKRIIKNSDCQTAPSTPNVGKLMEAVMKTDIEQALKMADSGSLTSDKSIKPPRLQDEVVTTEECFDCQCEKSEKEVTSSTKKPHDPNDKTKKINGKPPEMKTRENISSIVVKNEKLLPTVNFDRRKSILKSTTAVKKLQSKPISGITTEVPTKKHTGGRKCSCTNCRCPLKCKFRNLSKLCLIIRFTIAFVNSCMISLCQLFNEIAYDYKYIKRQLQKEKYAARKSISASSLKEGDDDFFEFIEFSHFMTANSTDDEKHELVYQVPIFIRLCISFYEVIMSSFNTVCYVTVLLLLLQNPNLFTIFLTLIVFLWGALSVPRPTKRFWKFILVYTAMLQIAECIFRVPIFHRDLPDLHYEYLNGPLLDQDSRRDFSLNYLFVMLSVFLQRRILMNIGLWNSELNEQRRGNIFSRMGHSVKNFYYELLNEDHLRRPVDLYTPIFFCDFLNIFVFIFAFTGLSELQENGVTKFFFENRIPPLMLEIIILHCVCIFVDRWIYLRRHMTAKLIFYVVQICFLSMCLYWVLPNLIFRKFNESIFPFLWYWLKSIYFLLSAYQIRSGYPPYVYGHVLCQNYSVVNLQLYQLYLFFPFVFELRSVTDWMWTETTLTFSEWLGMEDIFATVFILKCYRNYDNKYSYRRGQKISTRVKFFCGGTIVFLFLLLLICPLVFFTFGRVAGKSNVPLNMELSFRIASYPPIYDSFSSNVRSLNANEWKFLEEQYQKSSPAKNILNDYDSSDIGAVKFPLYSQQEWKLSLQIRNELNKTLYSGRSLSFQTNFELSRETENNKHSFKVRGFYTTTLGNEARSALLKCLHTTNTTFEHFQIDNILPKFLKVDNSAIAHSIDKLMIRDEQTSYNPYENSDSDSYEEMLDVNFTIECKPNADEWYWIAYHDYPNKNFVPRLLDEHIFGKVTDDTFRPIVFYTFNDKIFGGILSYISAQGILGLYTLVLVTIGFMIRKLCRNRVNLVFLDYIPNVDSILQLIMDIYFVREHKDGKLEEDLYAKLIFLFRSPETLIKWTRLAEESE